MKSCSRHDQWRDNFSYEAIEANTRYDDDDDKTTKQKKLEKASNYLQKKREKCLHQHAEVNERRQHTDLKCIYAQFTVEGNK